jgi:hypothetical protein
VAEGPDRLAAAACEPTVMPREGHTCSASTFSASLVSCWIQQPGVACTSPVAALATSPARRPGESPGAWMDCDPRLQSWKLRAVRDCRPSGWIGAHDDYPTGLVGWLTVARDASHGLDMSVCVHVEEDPAQPAYLLHSLDLYVPHALTF